MTLRAGAAGDVPLASLAYRFEANGRALVVAGTNPDPDLLAAFARGATLLAAEGSTPSRSRWRKRRMRPTSTA